LEYDELMRGADPNLDRLLDAIVPAMSAEAVYLFGSRARGEAHADSDYDLLVIVPDDFPRERMAPMETYELSRKVRIPADIIACRRSRFEDTKDKVGTLSYEATKLGRLVYGERSIAGLS
jgi:predicted nucleotidyltransferase